MKWMECSMLVMFAFVGVALLVILWPILMIAYMILSGVLHGFS